MQTPGYWKLRLAALSVLLAALVAGIAGTVEARNTGPPDTTPATSNLASFQVQVRDFSFSPNTLTTVANDPVTITVTNSGPAAHTFTIAGVADSGSIAAGQTRNVQFTPTRAGDLTFFCTIHGQAVMSGRISVMNPATNPVQPSQQQPAQPPVQQPAPPAPRPQVVMQPPSTGDAGLLTIEAE